MLHILSQHSSKPMHDSLAHNTTHAMPRAHTTWLIYRCDIFSQGTPASQSMTHTRITRLIHARPHTNMTWLIYECDIFSGAWFTRPWCGHIHYMSRAQMTWLIYKCDIFSQGTPASHSTDKYWHTGGCCKTCHGRASCQHARITANVFASWFLGTSVDVAFSRIDVSRWKMYTYMYMNIRGDGGWAKKGKKQKELLEPSLKTKPARAGWLKRLGLVRAAPCADFAVIGVKLCSSIIAILPCVALSHENCSIFRVIVDYCRPQQRPTIWILVQYFEHLVI